MNQPRTWLNQVDRFRHPHAVRILGRACVLRLT